MEIVIGGMQFLDDIVRIEKECFDKPWSERLVADHLKNENAVTFVCTDGGKAVGYAGMVKVLDEGQITNVAVLSDFRKSGFGDALITAMEKYSGKNGITFLTLEVRSSNLPAIGLYEKHGFLRVGLRKRYYEGTEDALLMTLERGETFGGDQK